MSKFKLLDGLMTSIEYVEVNVLLVEYNEKKYFQYTSLFPEGQKNIRNMKISPMYKFILEYTTCVISGKKFDYIDTKYYKMQRIYGRSHSYTMVKVSNFIKLFSNIKRNGLKEPPLIIPDENEFYQIKDGHHRVACCMALGQKKIACRVMGGQI